MVLSQKSILVGNGAAEIIKVIGDVIEGSFGMMFLTFNEYPESLSDDRIVKFIQITNHLFTE